MQDVGCAYPPVAEQTHTGFVLAYKLLGVTCLTWCVGVKPIWRCEELLTAEKVREKMKKREREKKKGNERKSKSKKRNGDARESKGNGKHCGLCLGCMYCKIRYS